MTRLWLAALAAAAANAAVTVYRPDDRSAALTATTSADAASYTGAAAYDPTVLTPPPVPQQFQRDYVVQLMQGGVDGLSIPHTGNYLGFSIELSVANRAIGTNSSVIAVPFLNHMQNVVNRAGSVRVRVGGNTQERALLLPNGFPDGSKAILKKTAESDTTTVTPHVEFTPELIQMLANVAQLIKTEMFLGLNFMDNITDPQNQALFAGMAQKMIGSSLKGIALGNEPDLYAGENHGKRPAPYTFDQYFNEWGTVANALTTNPDYTNRNILMGPSTCCRSSNPDFNNDAMAEAGYLTRFNSELGIITVQRYPTNNCGITPRTAQEEYPDFLSHALLSQHAAEYETFSRTVQAAGKPLYMFETNTAACGGFPGISDSFGAGLWATDWALKLATYNFSSTLLHVGGQGDYYNPFTPPPTNQSTFRQWTTGSVYYSTLIVAEFFGKSGKSQVIDLNANGGENLTPGYAVYEDGTPTRVLLINYIDDPSGAHDAIARIAIGGGTTGQPAGNPASVRVKYFAAPSVSFKGNMTWAGQTLGNHFESDGRLQGTEDVQTIQCDAASNTCAIPLKAPSLALVFLTDAAYQNSAPAEGATVSFETSVLTRVRHTATIDQAVLATSNGRGGSQGNPLGSTSFGSVGGAATMGVPGMGVLVGLAAGAVAVVMGLRW